MLELHVRGHGGYGHERFDGYERQENEELKMGTCMEPRIRGHQITHWIKDGTDDRYGYEW